ncbi:T-lymphocyte activation antigen CD80-like [Tachyglossus aculeatus]|uniref:T-lymphocyte activation antigen CD80-like n=1 Tax=Tachyglossus aculeatus TaxID=9261 RepID=UPI0018F61F37|nr:T-lymphocyte activation antigen CD80-like [Tachyglossus aculeatus]
MVDSLGPSSTAAPARLRTTFPRNLSSGPAQAHNAAHAASPAHAHNAPPRIAVGGCRARAHRSPWGQAAAIPAHAHSAPPWSWARCGKAMEGPRQARSAHPLLSCFLLLTLTGGLGSACPRTVSQRVGGAATLSCCFGVPEAQLGQHRIYWQKNGKVAMDANKEFIDPEYENRTAFDRAHNLSLIILPLRVSDSGPYECIVQKKKKDGHYERIHGAEVRLEVVGE